MQARQDMKLDSTLHGEWKASLGKRQQAIREGMGQA